MGGQGSGRPRLVEKCWDCDNTHRHSDGAVFCKIYAARVKEDDEPPTWCTKPQPRTGGMQKSRIPAAGRGE